MKLILEGVVDVLKENAEIKNEASETPVGPFVKPFSDMEKAFNSVERDVKKAQDETAAKVGKALGEKHTKIQDYGDPVKFGFDNRGRPVMTVAFAIHFPEAENNEEFYKKLKAAGIDYTFASGKAAGKSVVQFEYKKTF